VTASIPVQRPGSVAAEAASAGVAAAHLITSARGRSGLVPPGSADGGRPATGQVMPSNSKPSGQPSDAGAHAAPGSAHIEATEAARAERDSALAALLQQAAGGSVSAFEAFYDQTLGYAHALARRMLRSSGDLDDVLAAAYFQVWRELHRFDAQRGSAVTWLLTIVRSRALDALRHARVSDEHASAEEASDLASDEPGPDELLQTTQAGARLEIALAGLHPQERWVLALAYYRELSHSQIASVTGLPLGTVKSLILRSQIKLRELLVAC
jgi:RNA polymerase sigma-70 factor, ECF subfamily